MLLRIISGILFPAFALSVLVQYNDPDGWVWMLVYAFPAAIALAGVFGHAEILALPVSAVFWIGAALLMPWNNVDKIPEYVSAWHMTTSDSEYAREAIGLIICALYLEFVSVVWFIRRNAAATPKE